MKKMHIFIIGLFLIGSIAIEHDQNVLSKTYSTIRDSIITTAQKQIGTVYNYGKTKSNEGFDCAGLAQFVYHENGIEIPRTAKDQFSKGKKLDGPDNAKPGDLIFYASKTQWHVCILVDKFNFIEAPRTGYKVRPVHRTSMKDKYGDQDYVGVVTYISD